MTKKNIQNREINICFPNDVIVTRNAQKWYYVWQNDKIIKSDHISVKKHIVEVSFMGK